VLGLVLAACNTQGTGSPVDKTLSGIANGDNQDSGGNVVPFNTATANDAPVNLPPKDPVQNPRAYCPKTVMRAGTETLNIYPDKMKADDPDKSTKLRFRATITDVARECDYAGGGQFINMKVGVAGRALSGPSGETGEFTMPIRIAVTAGDSVLYSNLKDVRIEIPPGRSNAKFSYVDGAISIPKPQKENIIIYVGYDEQRTDDPAMAKKKKPVN